MTDFVVFPQPQIQKAKLKRIRKRVPKPPRNLKKLGIMLFKINLFQDCFFIGYELIAIQNRGTYSLSLIMILLLLAATFGLILLFIRTEDKLPVFPPSTEEVIAPELVFGFLATMPAFVIPTLNPSTLSEVIKYGIYASSCTIILFTLLFKSTPNNQILITIFYLLTVGLSTGMLFQVLLG
jgi:hypothetical protein